MPEADALVDFVMENLRVQGIALEAALPMETIADTIAFVVRWRDLVQRKVRDRSLTMETQPLIVLTAGLKRIPAIAVIRRLKPLILLLVVDRAAVERRPERPVIQPRAQGVWASDTLTTTANLAWELGIVQIVTLRVLPHGFRRRPFAITR